MIDVHMHILPGIDDGPETLEEALKSARLAEKRGIKKIIATPHSDGENLTKEDILAACENFNAELQLQHIDIEVLPGAEVSLGSNTGELLRDGRLLTINDGGRYILLELPGDNVPFYLTHVLRQIRALGVIPIIAHPERSKGLLELKSLWNEVLEIGVLLQVNAGSFTGFFGQGVAKRANKLARSGLVSLLGSDCHGIYKKRPGLDKGYEYLKNSLDLDTAFKIVYRNPQQLLKHQLLPAANWQANSGVASNIRESIEVSWKDAAMLRDNFANVKENILNGSRKIFRKIF